MRGKASAEFLFDAEPERSLRARLQKARQERPETSKATLTVSESEEEEVISVHSEHSDTESETMAADPPPVERLLGDYGGPNAPTGRLTIVNQPVNVAHFQLHPSAIRQLEKRPFSGKSMKMQISIYRDFS